MDHLLHIMSEILVPLFFVGMAGSMFVVLFTVIRDLQQIFTSDEEDDSEISQETARKDGQTN
ncbi:MAG TPA: hypothetical protein VGG95_04005 [Edaphobacter sp.]|jgi:hypothetical protein